jgi:hypothetical protein
VGGGAIKNNNNKPLGILPATDDHLIFWRLVFPTLFVILCDKRAYHASSLSIKAIGFIGGSGHF